MVSTGEEDRGRGRLGRDTRVLNRVAKLGLTEVTFEEGIEEEEGGSHADNWGKSSAHTTGGTTGAKALRSARIPTVSTCYEVENWI